MPAHVIAAADFYRPCVICSKFIERLRPSTTITRYSMSIGCRVR